MNNIAIITARGGSKRIPKKNIKVFCGKPIIAYSIEAAKNSGIFDEVMVSTDCEEIAEIARSYGASVPFMRSLETSNDTAASIEVLREVIHRYGERGRRFEYVSCIYPTAPFITAEKLKESYLLITEDETECVSTVVAFSFPPLRGNIIENGYLKYKWPEYYYKRSQDIETMYHECGQFWFYKTKALLEKEEFDMITKPYFINELEAQDIDNETDWKIAELKYRLINGMV